VPCFAFFPASNYIGLFGPIDPDVFGGLPGLPFPPENPNPWGSNEEREADPSYINPEPALIPAQPHQPVENPPWSFGDVVRLVVLAFVLIMVFSVLALSFAIGRMGTEAASELARDPRVVVPAQLGAYLFILGLMVFLVRSHGARFWRAIRWNWPAMRWVVYLGLGGALALAIQGFSTLLPLPKSLPIEHYFRSRSGAWLMTVFGVSLAPLMEELFFRGFLYPVVARRTGILAAVVITGAAFAALHAPQLGLQWIPTLLILLIGIILTAVRARTFSVAASFLVHVGYNGMLFALLYISTGGFRNLQGL
jgi:membrane protease YdiL (CAAX protease family)